jgi:hypothetical protein
MGKNKKDFRGRIQGAWKNKVNIFAFLMGITGVLLIAWQTSFLVAVGVFLFIWSNNIQLIQDSNETN